MNLTVTCKKKMLNVPYDLLHHCWHNNLVKELQFYLYLNAYTDGIFNNTHDAFVNANKVLTKDRRTINKYIARLQAIGWLSVDQPRGRYYLCSMKFILKNIGSD